jgi:PTS system galactitol-specific IIB component
MKKKIWLACGSGVASAGMAAHTLKRLCQERNLDVEIEVMNFREIRGKSGKPDVMVSIAPGFEKGSYSGLKDVPIIIGVSILSGIGVEETMAEIERVLKG